MDELNEMEDLLFDFRQRWAELLAQYDPEKGDTEQNTCEIGVCTLDYLQNWIDEHKTDW